MRAMLVKNKKTGPRPCFLLLLHSKLLIELIDSTLSGCQLLVSCVEWVALGTDFHVNFRLCGSCYKCVSTVTCYGCLVISWMNTFSHFLSLFLHDCQPCGSSIPLGDSLVFIMQVLSKIIALCRGIPLSRTKIAQSLKKGKSLFPKVPIDSCSQCPDNRMPL